MGLLDEAIREHLELKRRRGANPEEVAREEHDALGPVRREPESADDAALVTPEPPEPEAPSPPLVDTVPEEPLTPAAPQPPEPAGEPTAEWDFDDEEAHKPGAAKPPAKDEDVLEETPEFLQETPEHDKLWFEQKPPRDFDFNG
jgi:hypothetical protein